MRSLDHIYSSVSSSLKFQCFKAQISWALEHLICCCHYDVHLCFVHFSLCYAAATAKSLQACPALCDTIDGSPPGSDIPGILQASKNTGVGCRFLLQCMKVKVKGKSLNRVQLSATPWTAVYQAPPSMGFSR